MTTRAEAPVSDSPRALRQRVQAAEMAMTVLRGLARLGGRASLSALAEHVSESPAKVHRYLASLIETELVAQDPLSQQYWLAAPAIDIGLAAMRQLEPIRLAEPALQALRERLGVTCFLAVMGNHGPTIVRFEEPVLPVTVNVRAGSVLSLLWSATGRAFLGANHHAHLDAMAAAELAASSRERRSLLDAKDPIGVLRREVCERACACVRDTNLPGISAVAAPLVDYTGRAGAVLTALGASGGFDAHPAGPIAQAVRDAARAVSRALGQTL